MCEGGNELTIMNILLDNHLLTIDQDDLVGLSIYHSRQIDKTPQVQIALRQCFDNVVVCRIGDTLNEKLRIPSDFKDKIVEVRRYCTKPELERLVIIAAGLERDYQKIKSNNSPKKFVKDNKVYINRIRYSNSSVFYSEAFANSPELLVKSIREYQRIGNNGTDELYLAELLK